MAQNFIQEGEVLNYVVPSSTTITSQQVVEIGYTRGVALKGGTAGEIIPVKMCGVFSLTKKTTSGEVFAQGDRVFYDVSTSKVTVDTTKSFLGFAFSNAAQADTTVEVLLPEGTYMFNPMGTITDISTANATDLTTAQTLANACKAKINELLGALRGGDFLNS